MSPLGKLMRTTSYLPLLRASIAVAVISGAFMIGFSLNTQRSLGISTYVSSSSLNLPVRLPFQKYVTCPNFCVSEHANTRTPLWARYSPLVREIAGGGTRKLFG